MSKKQLFVSSLILICVLATAILAANKNFIPDVTFNGSALTGWHQLGQTDWRADHGEIVGTPKQANGGWLVLDRGYQDVEFFASFRCAGPCNPLMGEELRNPSSTAMHSSASSPPMGL